MKVSFNPYLVQTNNCRQTAMNQNPSFGNAVAKTIMEASERIGGSALVENGTILKKFAHLSPKKMCYKILDEPNLSEREFTWLYRQILDTHNAEMIDTVSDVAVTKFKGNEKSLLDLTWLTTRNYHPQSAAKLAAALAVNDNLIRYNGLELIKSIIAGNNGKGILSQCTKSLEKYMKYPDSKETIYSFLKEHLIKERCQAKDESFIFFDFLKKAAEKDLKESEKVIGIFEHFEKGQAELIAGNDNFLYSFLIKKVELAQTIFKKAVKEKPLTRDAENYAFNMMKGIVSKLDYPGQWDVFTGSVSLIKNLLVSDRQNSYGLGLLKEGLENSSTRQSMFEHDVFKTAFNNAQTKAGAFDLLEFKDTELFGMRWPKTFDALLEYAKDSQFTKRAFEKFKPALAENSTLKLVSLSRLSPFVKFTETREEALGYLYEALKSDDYRTRKVAVDCVFDFLGTDKELDGHARKILAPFIKRDFEMVVGDMNSIADFDILNSELGDLSLKFLDARRLLDNLNSLSNKELVINYTNYTEARSSYIKGAISFSQNSVQSLKDIPQLATPDIEKIQRALDTALQELYRSIGRI